MAATFPATLTGGCQCGAVRYELRAPQWASVCHCRMCQRASGQPFMAFVGGKPDSLSWTKGAPSTFRSSNIAERGFCAACGTPLTYGRPGRSLSVTIGSLDEAGRILPNLQNGVESKMDWVDAIASLPTQRTEEWLARAGVGAVASRQFSEPAKR